MVVPSVARQLTWSQEGIVTVVVAVSAFWFIYNYPGTSSFLTEPEKRQIHERLAADSDATLDEAFSWSAVLDAFKDPNCWLYGLGFHTVSLPMYTLSLFMVCARFPRVTVVLRG